MSLFWWKSFGQHLLTSVLPKWSFIFKNGRKIGRNHEITKLQGGFVALRCQDLVFGSEGLQSMCSTLPKPLDHISHGSENIESWILRKIGFLAYFWVFLGIFLKNCLFWLFCNAVLRHEVMIGHGEWGLFEWFRNTAVSFWWHGVILTRSGHFRTVWMCIKWLFGCSSYVITANSVDGIVPGMYSRMIPDKPMVVWGVFRLTHGMSEFKCIWY